MVPMGTKRTTDSQDDDERKRRRESWPDFDEPTPCEIESLARLRGISDYALREASLRGWLRFCDTKFGRAWVVTDSTRKNAQARLLRGDQWPDIEAKAKTLPGSLASTPLGLDDIGDADFVALFEGGPDWLAGLDLLGHRNRGQAFAVVGIIGAGMNLEPFASKFFGSHVRVFAHNDEAGIDAGRKWGASLLKAGARRVEVVTPPEGVKDWCDVLNIGRDECTAHREQIEKALTWGGPENV
jgi:hypothetical protein